MNVASKQLCEELFKLSGWRSARYYDVYGDLHNEPLRGICHPAYDLDYLMGRLQILCATDSPLREITIALMRKEWGWWRAYYETKYDSHKETWIEDSANIPVDAVCKLTIELFKQGILERGE